MNVDKVLEIIRNWLLEINTPAITNRNNFKIAKH